MSIEQNLPFPMSEFEARMAKLHQKMDEANVDAMVVGGAANLYYLSGETHNWEAPAQFMIVPQDGDPRMVVMITEEYNAENFNWVKDWVSYKPDAGVDVFKVVQEQLSDMGLADRRIGVAKHNLPMSSYEHQSALLPQATLVDTSLIVEYLRMIKSPAEIEYMRQSARAAEAGMRAGFAAVKEGATENEVAAEVYAASILAGSGHMFFTSFICAGDRTHIPHATWSGKEIKKGDIVFLEISGRVKYYTVPLMRTSILGEPSEEVARSAQACVVAVNRTIEAMKPGVQAKEVQEACLQAFVDEGYGIDTFRHAAGYTIGLQWGELVNWALGYHETQRLEPGMTFHLVPHLEFYDEKYTVGCGEAVLITENGAETLTNFERKLFVL